MIESYNPLKCESTLIFVVHYLIVSGDISSICELSSVKFINRVAEKREEKRKEGEWDDSKRNNKRDRRGKREIEKKRENPILREKLGSKTVCQTSVKQGKDGLCMYVIRTHLIIWYVSGTALGLWWWRKWTWSLEPSEGSKY